MMRRRHYMGFCKAKKARLRSEMKPPAELSTPELMIYAAEIIEREVEIDHAAHCVPPREPCVCRGRGRLRAAAQLRERARNILHPKKEKFRFGEWTNQLKGPLDILDKLLKAGIVGKDGSKEPNSGG